MSPALNLFRRGRSVSSSAGNKRFRRTVTQPRLQPPAKAQHGSPPSMRPLVILPAAFCGLMVKREQPVTGRYAVLRKTFQQRCSRECNIISYILIVWLRVFSLIFLNVADFKGIRAW